MVEITKVNSPFLFGILQWVTGCPSTVLFPWQTSLSWNSQLSPGSQVSPQAEGKLVALNLHPCGAAAGVPSRGPALPLWCWARRQAPLCLGFECYQAVWSLVSKLFLCFCVPKSCLQYLTTFLGPRRQEPNLFLQKRRNRCFGPKLRLAAQW